MYIIHFIFMSAFRVSMKKYFLKSWGSFYCSAGQTQKHPRSYLSTAVERCVSREPTSIGLSDG